MSIELHTPLTEKDISSLNVGDTIYLSGTILCGRDAVLPKIVSMLRNGTISDLGLDLQGGVMFHTAVSPAGVGPTSSNKLEIESSIEPLSAGGIRLHLGKGALGPDTVAALERHHAVYAIIPPVTALLAQQTRSQCVAAFPELGMEALHLLTVERYPAVIAAAKGRSIYE